MPAKVSEEKEPIDTVLEETKKYYETLHEASRALDTKASILLGSGTLLLALVSAFQDPKTFPTIWEAFSCYIIVGVVLYVLLFLCGIFAIVPVQWTTPVKIDREELQQHYLPLSSEKLKWQLLGNYVDRIQENRAKIARKGKAVAIGFAILGVEVVYLLVLTFFIIR